MTGVIYDAACSLKGCMLRTILFFVLKNAATHSFYIPPVLQCSSLFTARMLFAKRMQKGDYKNHFIHGFGFSWCLLTMRQISSDLPSKGFCTVLYFFFLIKQRINCIVFRNS